jgi:nucleotide-binding universal stress UspA family protein
MAANSHRLSNSFEGALAGGGDPASSPLYVFGPFLRLIVVVGVAPVTFGASVWMVVLTVAVVSAMYRLVMMWVTDGSGGSGLTEEEFGAWAMKVNAGITVVEYTLTFLVSITALVTFIEDRWPQMQHSLFGISNRTLLAIVLSLLVGWLVNRGPKTAARSFGPATLGVLVLLWAMVIATVVQRGFHLPEFHLKAFHPAYLHYTLDGYAHILALMTGIEVFANLVAAYEGTDAQKSRRAFGSLMIIMGTTLITMLIVGPAILSVSDPYNPRVSVFTQTMDRLLPWPLPYLGTMLGAVVLASAAAASAQGVQNLALGMRYRNYLPPSLGRRNAYGVADRPVWIEVGVATLCYFVFGTQEETYLTLYAAGVFVLLSMTGWAAVKRLAWKLSAASFFRSLLGTAGISIAALLTTGASILIFVERFSEGVWAYFLIVPVLYAAFGYVRRLRGAPTALDDHLGRFYTGQYLLPFQRRGDTEDETGFDHIVVPLNGSAASEHALLVARLIAMKFASQLLLGAYTDSDTDHRGELNGYTERMLWQLQQTGASATVLEGVCSGPDHLQRQTREANVSLIVLGTRDHSTISRLLRAERINGVEQSRTPLLILRPTKAWRSRGTQFQRLLVCLDGSEAAEQVLRYARTLAKAFQSEIVVVAVAEVESEEKQLTEYVGKVAEALRELGIVADCLVSSPVPAQTIVAIAEQRAVDLILMATSGRGDSSLHSAFGSVTEEVMRSTPCPLLLVPVKQQGPRR